MTICLAVCGSTACGPKEVCVAGKTETCTCASGRQGAQVCNSDGTAWGACSCEASGSDSGTLLDGSTDVLVPVDSATPLDGFLLADGPPTDSTRDGGRDSGRDGRVAGDVPSGTDTTVAEDAALPSCGNDSIDLAAGEVCDGERLNGETCWSKSGYHHGQLQCTHDCLSFDSSDCHECGNNNLEGPEECDTGGMSSTCNDDCTFSECGDWTYNWQGGEDCDDGNRVLDACRYGVSYCLVCGPHCSVETGLTSYCGDDVVDEVHGESCDELGDTANCDNDCTPVVCGDGHVNLAAGEECDNGNANSDDSCLDAPGERCLIRRIDAGRRDTVPEDTALSDGQTRLDSAQYDVSYGCVNDPYEPNDTVQQAFHLSRGVLRNGMICGSDIDWYSLDVENGEALGILINNQATWGDIDAQLFVAGGSTIGEFLEYGYEDQLLIWNYPTGIYYLKVVRKPSHPYAAMAAGGLV